MKIKLHLKLTFFFLLAVLIGLVAGYFFLAAHLKADLDAGLEKNLKHEALLAKDFLEIHARDRGTLEDANILADRIGQMLGVRVTVIRADGRVIGDSDLTPQEIAKVENHLSRVEVQAALHQGMGISKRYSYTIKKYLLYVAVPFGKEPLDGVIRLSMPMADIQFLEARAQQIVLFGIILVLMLSTGFTYIISLVVSKPLREMSAVARAMASGDFSRKPSIVSQDEVGELARAITHMSEEIEEKIIRIKKEAAKLDAVLSSMSEGIMVVDDKGRIVIMNPSLRKAFLVNEAPQGRLPVEVIRNSVVAVIVEQLTMVRSRAVSEEVALAEDKVFQVNGVAIIREGRFEGAVLVFHDISELRRLEKVRQDFVANVSHELRTPVSSIKGYAETLLDGAIDDKAHAREFVEIIRENSDRLVRLIEDLLDLARIESGKMHMALVPVDIAPIVHRSLGILENQIRDKALAVSIEFLAALPKVLADETRLSQVLLNLLDNAVKYTPDRGSIKIRAVVTEERMQVDVIDNGIGIPEKDLPRIFERFYRVDKARSKELGGTGLGLSIVKHIVHAHGGDVWVSSVIDEGTVFSFTLPLA
ncbi:MAG: HAMP domain-containing protein [Candidatus Omnitrophica bacterium]|nr:HAMP domain-containing protein [Candidatus Omnitrophota bacterium]